MRVKGSGVAAWEGPPWVRHVPKYGQKDLGHLLLRGKHRKVGVQGLQEGGVLSSVKEGAEREDYNEWKGEGRCILQVGGGEPEGSIGCTGHGNRIGRGNPRAE